MANFLDTVLAGGKPTPSLRDGYLASLFADNAQMSLTANAPVKLGD